MSEESGARKRGGAGSGDKSLSQVSVIVPAYNETENIRPLCERLFKATKGAGVEAEMIVVDDESAGSEETAKIVKKLESEGHPVRIHCRKKKEGRGLSSAVLLGFELAKYQVILCMDADLQHEPESVPDVAKPVLTREAEFAIGSRHVAGGGLGFEWSMIRQVISMGASLLAYPLAASTDPMSGFFCTRKDILARGRKNINPIGFKIGLEVMVRCRCATVQDVGITFQERIHGESKLSAKQYQLYLQQLASLYWDKFNVFFPLVLVLLAMFAFMLLATVPKALTTLR